MRKALDSEDYDKVRDILYGSEEGVLAKYIRKEEDKENKEAMRDDKSDWELISWGGGGGLVSS